jgi:hypothetical protein
MSRGRGQDKASVLQELFGDAVVRKNGGIDEAALPLSSCVSSVGGCETALFFCSMIKVGPKVDHQFGASVGEHICDLQCLFKTHFGILGNRSRSPN